MRFLLRRDRYQIGLTIQYSRLMFWLYRIPILGAVFIFWADAVGNGVKSGADALAFSYLGDCLITGGQPITEDYYESWYGKRRLPLKLRNEVARRWTRKGKHSYWCGSDRVRGGCSQSCNRPYRFMPEPHDEVFRTLMIGMEKQEDRGFQYR